MRRNPVFFTITLLCKFLTYLEIWGLKKFTKIHKNTTIQTQNTLKSCCCVHISKHHIILKCNHFSEFSSTLINTKVEALFHLFTKITNIFLFEVQEKNHFFPPSKKKKMPGRMSMFSPRPPPPPPHPKLPLEHISVFLVPHLSIWLSLFLRFFVYMICLFFVWVVMGLSRLRHINPILKLCNNTKSLFSKDSQGMTPGTSGPVWGYFWGLYWPAVLVLKVIQRFFRDKQLRTSAPCIRHRWPRTLPQRGFSISFFSFSIATNICPLPVFCVVFFSLESQHRHCTRRKHIPQLFSSCGFLTPDAFLSRFSHFSRHFRAEGRLPVSPFESCSVVLKRRVVTCGEHCEKDGSLAQLPGNLKTYFWKGWKKYCVNRSRKSQQREKIGCRGGGECPTNYFENPQKSRWDDGLQIDRCFSHSLSPFLKILSWYMYRHWA